MASRSVLLELLYRWVGLDEPALGSASMHPVTCMCAMV